MAHCRTIRIHDRRAPVTHVLGPGTRAVIWVQGCPFACPGCMSPDARDPVSGEDMPVTALAEWVLAQPDIEGVTFSGGEPMEQAAALSDLVDLIRRSADPGVMCYTGYTVEDLQAKGTPEQMRLLERIDILVDGPYVRELHADLLWRASSNQRLLPLTGRYRRLLEAILRKGDRSAGIECYLDENGAPQIVGVPPMAGFRANFESLLRERGIILKTT